MSPLFFASLIAVAGVNFFIAVFSLSGNWQAAATTSTGISIAVFAIITAIRAPRSKHGKD